ncbi:ABC transporter ATP-binding protein [Collinsella sp. An2]|uniref:ABC transporter ATP-binding protein n=1 Tax=Collinsella sp. An2 TaxID=1965585 RepID=UPI000B392C0B|nr:ABC transporter ATP-binding protein [Collinsella sp. An2]OUP09464.1 hypothetical protein B5F33_04660 [Collinsella sp. An2]
MNNNGVITVHDITKRYGKRVVLDSVNMTVYEGDVCALIGENGAGKSTLINILVGLTRPSSGSIALLGATGQSGLLKARMNIGYVPDASGAYQEMSARGNLIVRCAEWGVPKGQVVEVLKKVNLLDAQNLKVKRYSLGMKRRLDIATALLGNPAIIIMDEPINGLDPTGIAEVREIIRTLREDDGKTILLSSHNLPELQRIATRFVFMSHGRVLQEVGREELNGASDVTVKLKVSDVLRAKRLLEDKSYTDSVALDGDQGLEIKNPACSLGSLVGLLVQNGITVEEAYDEHESLEEYYGRLLAHESDASQVSS